MDDAALETAIILSLSEIRKRLKRGAGIAKAAEAYAVAGNVPKGVEIVLDVEQLVYEVETLLNSASLMQRLYRDGRK